MLTTMKFSGCVLFLHFILSVKVTSGAQFPFSFYRVSHNTNFTSETLTITVNNIVRPYYIHHFFPFLFKISSC
jgi:hypothetical protein